MVMGWAERILLALSREPGSGDYPTGDVRTGIDTALEWLNREIPDFDPLVAGKRIADFGCGYGYQSVALASLKDCSVVGIDLNPESLNRARLLAESHGLREEQLRLVQEIEDDMRGTFDVVISQNSMEHFGDPATVISEMTSLLRPAGKLMVCFGPPWFAPYGSHMHFFCRVPWLNLFFREAVVMKVRANFRSDGATRYVDVESGLNRMSVRRFERIASESGLVMSQKRYTCVKKLTLLGRIPILRELFINYITVVLERPQHSL